MRDELQHRVRNLLATSTTSFRSWALARLTEVLVRVSERVPVEVRATGQRFGNQLWKRIAARYPALDEMMRDVPPFAAEFPTVESEHVPSAAPVTTASPVATPMVAPLEVEVAAPQAVLEVAVPQSNAPLMQHTDVPPREVPQQLRDMPALLRALRDPSAEVAAAAASALSRHASPSIEAQCLAALREVLANDEGYFNPITRVAALQSLVQRLGAAPSLAELEPMLRAVRDVDAEVSVAAIFAVAMHAPHEVAQEYLAPIVSDQSGFFLPLVQNAASRALARASLFRTSN